MVRYTRFVGFIVFSLGALPGSVLAQPVKLPPDAPIAPIAPIAPPFAPVPPLQPMPALPPMLDLPLLKADIERMKLDKERFKVDMDAWKADMQAFNLDMQDFKIDMQDFHFDLPLEFAQSPKPVPGEPRVAILRGGDNNEDRNYQNGTRALDAGRWDEAIEYFTRVVNLNATRADGAMYWIAWAENKRGNGAAALDWLQRLEKTHKDSRWITEARSLGVEIRQRAGQPVKPENVPDEELRLMALNSLAQADDQRAVPMLEKIVNGTGSPRLKERALYVLAQKGSPEARAIIIKIARGGNPDLQARAVQHLGAFGGADSRQALLDIFKSSTNLAVKRNILRSFMQAGDRTVLLDVARTEAMPELRAEAVQQLGSMGAQEQLLPLYATEKTVEVRKRIIQAMFARHNPDTLVQLLKTETEPELRRTIIQNLGQMGSPQGAAAMQAIYASEKDETVKRAVIDAFSRQRNAKVLIELSKKETDPALKRRIVERIAQTKTPEATDFLMEILQ
jgi:HEAT repeat protein